MVNISGLDLADVLAALYNAAVKIGMGNNSSMPNILFKEEAEQIIRDKGLLYDYLGGKRMKLSLTNVVRNSKTGQIIYRPTNFIDTTDYERYYGPISKRALDFLRESNDPCDSRILALQAEAQALVDEMTRPLVPPGTVIETPGMSIFFL